MNYKKGEIYQSEAMDVDERNEDDNWEVEINLLKQQIKDLENALDKSKKFHRKFTDDVIESEEIRNKDFERVKRELNAIIKRQKAEIRELTRDKKFYETTCNAMITEKEMSSNAENSSQSTSVLKPLLPTKCSTTESLKLTTQPRTEPKSSRSGSRPKISLSDSKFKMSTKLFQDNKKLKEKISKVTKSNATLRLQVNQLENFKRKIQSKKQQQVADQQEMQDLLLSTKRTNSQIFNKLVLSQLDQYHRMQPNIEHLYDKQIDKD